MRERVTTMQMNFCNADDFARSVITLYKGAKKNIKNIISDAEAGLIEADEYGQWVRTADGHYTDVNKEGGYYFSPKEIARFIRSGYFTGRGWCVLPQIVREALLAYLSPEKMDADRE